MARIDSLTADFIEKVASGAVIPPTPVEDVHAPNKVTSAIKAIKSIIDVKNNPIRTIPRAALRGATKKLLHAADSSYVSDSLNKTAAAGPLEVFKYINEKYGKEWWGWESETIVASLKTDTHIDVDETLGDLIGALQVLVNTNQVHEHWHIFENVTHALNGNPVDFHVLQPVKSEEAAFAFKVIGKVRPSAKYEDEVYGYVACACQHEGLVYLPPELFPAECQNKLREITFDRDLEEKVRQLWSTDKDKGTDDLAIRLQLEHLRNITEYVVAG